MVPVIERLMRKVTVYPDGCWIWTGWTNGRGYGKISRGGRGAGTEWVHRVSYMHHVGPIPDGLVLDHLCRTPPCVNPAHLEPVAHAENMRRTRDDLCANAHEGMYEDVKQSDGRVQRVCRGCQPKREPSAHGTRSKYTKGCRCGPCREANRNYERERRARLDDRYRQDAA